MKTQPDMVEGQSVLYNSAIFCSSDISDGNPHNHDDMPIVLAGKRGWKAQAGPARADEADRTAICWSRC